MIVNFLNHRRSYLYVKASKMHSRLVMFYAAMQNINNKCQMLLNLIVITVSAHLILFFALVKIL